MPLFCFLCPKCAATKRRICASAPDLEPCKGCGNAMDRVPGTPGVSVVEVLDNGCMSRPIERLSESPRLHLERNKASDEDTKNG